MGLLIRINSLYLKGKLAKNSFCVKSEIDIYVMCESFLVNDFVLIA